MTGDDILVRLRAIADAPFSVPLHFRQAALDAIHEIESARYFPAEYAVGDLRAQEPAPSTAEAAS